LNRTVAKAIYAYVQEYGKPPGDHLPDLLIRELEHKDDGPLLSRILVNISALRDKGGFNEEYVNREMEAWVRIARQKKAVADVVEAHHANNFGLAEKLFRDYQDGHAPSAALKPLTRAELKAFKALPREFIMAPFLRNAAGVEVTGGKSAGKTYLTMGMCHALARGGELIDGWRSSRPCVVLYLDGEVGVAEMEMRWKKLDKAYGATPDNGIRTWSFDQEDRASPNIATEEGMAEIDGWADECKADVIVLDTASSFCRADGEPDGAEFWLLVEVFINRQRRKGRTILIPHHLGKNPTRGGRGHSKQMDVMDCVLQLERDTERSTETELVVKFQVVHSRFPIPDSQRYLDLTMEQKAGLALGWRAATTNRVEVAVQLLNEGQSSVAVQAELRKQFNVSRPTAYRDVQKAQESMKQNGTPKKRPMKHE